ncbi:MAG: carboxypeptidase regulatory-like domain-containing protein [Gemmatimonadota bacterium]
MRKSFDPFRVMALAGASGFLLACGGGDAGSGGAASDDGGDDAAASAPAVDPATTGAVVGTITFTGAVPAPEMIDMSDEPVCNDKHGGQPMRSPVKAGDGGGLAEVFVYIKEGLAEQDWGAAGAMATLDQNGCEYVPHVLGLRTGQDLEIVNSDGLLHNINASPEANRGFNISQPTNMTSTRSFSQPEIMIPLRCDVHGWMEAYVAVMEHPFFAVSAEDGTYRIEGLPAGDYTIAIWHETLGEREMVVNVAAQAEATADFSVDESLAGTARMGHPVAMHDAHAGGAAAR